MHHSRARRALNARLLGVAAVLLCLSPLATPAAAAVPEVSPIGLNRWFGAEAGFEEIACWGPGVACPGFGTIATFDGTVGTRSTEALYPGLTESEPWPSRTGSRLFMAATPGGSLATAALSTLGSDVGPFKGGTISLGVRVHWLPPVPVIIYRHIDPDAGPTILLTLTVDGSIVASTATGTLLGVTSRKITTHEWHTLGLTYGPKSEVFRLWLDGGSPQISQTLTGGGPGGDLSLGIVNPTTVKFAIAFDDIVEVTKVDASIHGARINYLMPHGQEGAGGWGKQPTEPVSCVDAAEPWQMISEDQEVSVPEEDISCGVSGGSITTAEPHASTVFPTDGVPSSHSPSRNYLRDVTLQPQSGEAIHGIRTRIRGKTDGPPASLTVDLLGGGRSIADSFGFEGDFFTRWGPSHFRYGSGSDWTPATLDALRMRLDSGPATDVQRWVSGLLLDYVWVPS